MVSHGYSPTPSKQAMPTNTLKITSTNSKGHDYRPSGLIGQPQVLGELSTDFDNTMERRVRFSKEGALWSIKGQRLMSSRLISMCLQLITSLASTLPRRTCLSACREVRTL